MSKVFLLLLTAIVLGCGTDQGEGKTYKYTVVNESGQPLKIKSYRSNAPKLAPIITTLDVGQEINKSFYDDLPPSEYNFVVFFGGNEDRHRDSIVVIYDEKRFNSFKRIGCAGSERNPLNVCMYGGTEEIFVFTEEDYENATPCGDRSCE